MSKKRSILLFAFATMVFVPSSSLVAGWKKLPFSVLKFGAKKTVTTGVAVASKSAQTVAKAGAGMAAHQAVKTAVK